MSSVGSDIDISITYGPLFPFVSDPSVEEIWINTPERIFVARNGRSELTNLLLTDDEVRNIVERALMWSGRRLDLSQPFVDARLPDGSRLHVTIPEITAEHWAVNIRKHLLRHLELTDLVELDVLTTEVCEYLQMEVFAGANILVSGATQAGKTTMLNALVSAIPTNERVITVEEVFELRPKLPDCVALQTRPPNLQGEGEITLRRLIKEALRMRPFELVVGEIREAESLDLLIALNSGIPGMATIHANSARDAIRKLQTLPLLAGENISHKFIAPVVANSIDLVVQIGISKTGYRRVLEIARVNGRLENDQIEIETIYKLIDKPKPYYISEIIKDCYGYDVSNYQLPNKVKKVDSMTDNYFEVITFFDSLEHILDIDFVKNLSCNYICISVPWCHYLSDEWFKNWYHRRENEHIYHFNEESLKALFKECGYECIYEISTTTNC